MFSEDIAQEIAALLIAAIALAYALHKITGWPRRKKSAPVHVGDRLARGLKSKKR